MEDPGPVIGDEGAPEDGEADFASVVLVEKGEDVAAVCGRVDAAPTWAVVLHAPEGNRQLTAELGMRRLIHHAADSGKVIAFATRSASLASRARELGVPVARKPHHVRWDAGGKHVMRMGRLNLAAPSIGRYVQVGVIAGVALLAVFLAFSLAPSATVTAYPPTETVSQVITVTASESTSAVNLETLEVPAELVSAERTFTLAVKTTGTTQVGTVAAKVRVTVSNATTAAVVVAQGTVAFGPEFRGFTFDETISVPPSGSTEAAVTATEPGTAGNVAAGTITGWEVERLRFLKLTNAAAAAGGVSEPRAAVDSKDALALADLAKALETSPQIKDSLVEDRARDAVFLGTARSTVELGTVQPAVGTPSAIATLEVKVTLSALAVVEETLNEVASHVLRGLGGNGEFVPGTVRATETGSRQLDADSATVRTELRVQGELARGLTAEAVRDAVAGKSEDDARSTLRERYGIQDADVRLSAWAPRLPRFGFRIDVALAAREPSPGPRLNLPNGTTTSLTAAATPPAGTGPR